MKQNSIYITIATLICGFNICVAGQGDFTHAPSGITFPANIEGHFTLGPIEEGAATAKKASFYYLFPDGHRVIVSVYPAPPDAHGPTKLDGDSKSDPSPAFMKEFESLKNAVLSKDDSMAITGQTRFRAAPQQGGVLGMKVSLRGTTTTTDLLLLERNGHFIKISSASPSENNLGYGIAYTDVAHFIKWPSVKK